MQAFPHSWTAAPYVYPVLGGGPVTTALQPLGEQVHLQEGTATLEETMLLDAEPQRQAAFNA